METSIDFEICTQTRLNVLLIEDSQLYARAIEHAIQKEAIDDGTSGISTVWCSTLAEGVEAIVSSEIDAILLDLNLPDAKGYEALDQLIQFSRDVPIIVLTGIDDPQDGLNAIRKGAVDFLSKIEMNPRLLGKTIRYAVERRILNNLNLDLRVANAELDAARQIQELMNRQYDPVSGFEVFGHCVPANTVGGDFWDVIKFDDENYFGYVADVSGHGIGAGFLSAQVSGLIRGLVLAKVPVLEIVRHIEEYLVKYAPPSKYITGFFFRINNSEIEYISAAHPAWIILPDGQAKEFSPSVAPLGLSLYERCAIETVTEPFVTDSLFVIPTDGAYEPMNSDDVQYGVKRLIDVVTLNRHRPLDEIKDILLQDLESHVGDCAFTDDFTLLQLRKRQTTLTA